MNIPKPTAPTHTTPTPAIPASRLAAGAPQITPAATGGTWRERMAAKVKALEARAKADLWAQL